MIIGKLGWLLMCLSLPLGLGCETEEFHVNGQPMAEEFVVLFTALGYYPEDYCVDFKGNYGLHGQPSVGNLLGSHEPLNDICTPAVEPNFHHIDVLQKGLVGMLIEVRIGAVPHANPKMRKSFQIALCEDKPNSSPTSDTPSASSNMTSSDGGSKSSVLKLYEWEIIQNDGSPIVALSITQDDKLQIPLSKVLHQSWNQNGTQYGFYPSIAKCE